MLTIILTKDDVQITNQDVPTFSRCLSGLAMDRIKREVRGLISFPNMIDANRYIYQHREEYRIEVCARVIDLRHVNTLRYRAYRLPNSDLPMAIWKDPSTCVPTCEGFSLNRAILDYPIFDLMTGKVVQFGRVYAKCEDCGKWFYRGFSKQTRCETCRPRSKTCIVCGKKFMGAANDLCCSDQCKNIKRERIDTASIRYYSYKPACRFQTVSSGPSNEPSVGNLYLGFELEVAGRDHYLDDQTCAGIVQNLLPNTYCKYDGSVDGGFEIVSHPGTLAFHHKNGARFRKAMRILTGLKFENENRQCGLHVHVNRAFLRNKGAAIAKLVCLSDRFYDELMTFARRPAGSQHWCRKNGDEYHCSTREDYVTRYRYSCNPGERYLAINLQNRHTVEFRIFHSTMDWQTFIASLQLVDTMVRYACTHKWTEIMSCSFADMTASNHKELNEYLARLNLVSNVALAA